MPAESSFLPYAARALEKGVEPGGLVFGSCNDCCGYLPRRVGRQRRSESYRTGHIFIGQETMRPYEILLADKHYLGLTTVIFLSVKWMTAPDPTRPIFAGAWGPRNSHIDEQRCTRCDANTSCVCPAFKLSGSPQDLKISPPG